MGNNHIFLKTKLKTPPTVSKKQKHVKRCYELKTSKTDPKRWRQYLIASVRTIFYYNTTFSDKLNIYLLQENIVTLNHNIS